MEDCMLHSRSWFSCFYNSRKSVERETLQLWHQGGQIRLWNNTTCQDRSLWRLVVKKNKFAYHRFPQSKEFDEMCSNRNAESFKAALENVSSFIFPVWRVPKYFARWGKEPHACVLDGFPWHDSSVTWLCEIHLYWQLGTSCGCFRTYAFIVSCLWPPKLISIFPAIGVGGSWSKTSILQSTKLSSRKISQQ